MLATEMIYLNTRRPPFDNVKVRRALNYATDRGRVVEIKGGGGLSVPTCQTLPTAFPGYAPYCPYTTESRTGRGWTAPNMERARRLVAESGAAGERVVLVMPPWTEKMGQYFERLLHDLGFRASLRITEDWDPTGKRRQIGFIAYSADYFGPSGSSSRCSTAAHRSDEPVVLLRSRVRTPGRGGARRAGGGGCPALGSPRPNSDR
jgi:ABC-type transport system substrate-binding protein